MVGSPVGLEPRACSQEWNPGRKEDEAKETDGRMEDAAGPVEWDERLKRHKTWDKEGATENGSSIGP